MTTLCLQEEEMLPEKVEGFPVLYDKRVKVFKEKDSAQNAWEKVAESLQFAQNSNFIRESSNWEYFVILKKLVRCSVSVILTKY